MELDPLDPACERAPLPEALARPERGRVLLVAPHPDDDVLGAGGTVCLHRQQGDPVHVVIGYDGYEGDVDRGSTRAEYCALRQREARAGGRHLLLEDYEFLGHPEGHVPSEAQLLAAAHLLAGRIAELGVDTIYSPWIGEQHVDHHVMARAVRLAVALADFRGRAWGYEVWTPLVPTRVVDVSSVHDRKVAALREHGSQLEHRDLERFGLAVSAQRAIYVSPAATHAEAFRPLGAPFGSDASLAGA
jgi:LmbE family N-acetylglucosaminyl deacetylase